MNTSTESIVELTQRLVRTPSQGGIDPLEPVIEIISEWLSVSDLKWQILPRSGRPVGVLITLRSGRPGPVVCLDAPIDTAPVGRVDAWNSPPFEPVIRGGRMYGRGAADAKVAVAIFCHVARELSRTRSLRSGELHVLLDGDEHTGGFGGVRAYAEQLGNRPDFVAVGYPGNWGIKTGSRGFYRAVLSTFGKEKHSGARDDTTRQNAIVKMAQLIQALSSVSLPSEPDPEFAFGPKLSVTRIEGGAGFSQIPGQCDANLDVRLTPSFGATEAERLIDSVLRQIDRETPTGKASSYTEDSTWPPYRLDPDLTFVRALRSAAERAFQREIYSVVAGPSNIGNYLASLQIPATCGFGVNYENQHATDEYIELETVAPVYQTYYDAVTAWCNPTADTASDVKSPRNSD